MPTVPSSSTMLILTVGGSPPPVAASVLHWRPARVLFLPSRDSRSKIEQEILPLLQRESFDLDPGRYDVEILDDEQDLTRCLEQIRHLTPRVQEWVARGDEFEVVVDITAGTKAMSSALALQAHEWVCRYSYVGGTERDKGGVGVVVSGKEQIVHTQNPWKVMGFRALDRAITLFDHGDFAAATQLIKDELRLIQDTARKCELSAISKIAEAHLHWDRFQHGKALGILSILGKDENHLIAALGQKDAKRLLDGLKDEIRILQEIELRKKVPCLPMVKDLIGNAARRSREGRFDDAVARLYRAIEAIAQMGLLEDHGISGTDGVPLERVPEPFRTELTPRARDRCVKIGLQDAYRLLRELGDERGNRFEELGLAHLKKSPLLARNNSILAHGFEPVSEKVLESLHASAMSLAGLDETQIVKFPKIRSRDG